MRILLILFVFLALAQMLAQAKSPEPKAQPLQPVTIEGYREWEYVPPIIRFQEGVTFVQGQKRLSAETAEYNRDNQSGVMQQASFTTCDRPHPDFRLTARRVVMTPDQRLKLERVRVYLGGTRIVSVPRLTMNLARRGAVEGVLPKIGYGSRDGLYLELRLALMHTERSEINLEVKPTTKRGLQSEITGGYAIFGSTANAPIYSPDYAMELRRQTLVLPENDNETLSYQQPQPIAALTSVFGAMSFRHRVPDVDQPRVLVSRLPELGVRYVGPEKLILTQSPYPLIGGQVQFRSSWGRFKESANGEITSRWDARGVATTTLAKFGDSAALRGSALGRYSRYQNGDRYGVLGGLLDVSRIFKKGTYASLRLIGHSISGATPFEFDDVDIKNELQGTGRYVSGRNTYFVVLDYDLDRGSLRNWEFTYARRLHCIEPSITWESRIKQVSIGVRVLGL